MTMTLKEAIEILTPGSQRTSTCSFAEFAEARKLGVERLKRIQRKRLDHWVLITPPLPGETEE